jgi:hypothetical protein
MGRGGAVQRCAYFVDVDNGVKHMAWALSIPDIHRLLTAACTGEELAAHLRDVRAAMEAFRERGVFWAI